jgi:hypothetical protein
VVTNAETSSWKEEVMRRSLTVAAVVATSLALVLSGVSLASPSGGGSRPAFEVVAPGCGSTDTECNAWDLPPAAPPFGPADGFTYSTPFFDLSGTVVGHNYGVCTVLVADPITDQCAGTLSFDDGDIVVQGIFHEGNAPSDSLAIVGGTGRFSKARGEAVLSFADDGIHFVIHLRSS